MDSHSLIICCKKPLGKNMSSFLKNLLNFTNNSKSSFLKYFCRCMKHTSIVSFRMYTVRISKQYDHRLPHHHHHHLLDTTMDHWDKNQMLYDVGYILKTPLWLVWWNLQKKKNQTYRVSFTCNWHITLNPKSLCTLEKGLLKEHWDCHSASCSSLPLRRYNLHFESPMTKVLAFRVLQKFVYEWVFESKHLPPRIIVF